ncbi:MAG: aspartate carbamoyltransferase catalytic subunit [Thermaerobacter sp.]|nr:aspartate carbamoyltransferase catalytic subunit [Thermaerobacter sp.]
MRHLLAIRDLAQAELQALVARGLALREGATPAKAQGAIATVFYEDSTRTRLSFQQAGALLGLHHLSISTEGSSIQKGESVEDTLRTVAALGARVAAVRSPWGLSLQALTDLPIQLVNAGDGWAQHPTQAIADLIAVKREFGEMQGRTLLIVGDILHSRVARSNAEGFRALGARVLLAGPPTLLPPGLAQGLGAEEVQLEEGLRQADVCMVLRLQRERQERGYLPSIAEYRRLWGLTAARAALLHEGAVILHPGPQNRDVEIDDELVAAPQSRIAEQITSGVYGRAAVLEAMLDAH